MIIEKILKFVVIQVGWGKNKGRFPLRDNYKVKNYLKNQMVKVTKKTVLSIIGIIFLEGMCLILFGSTLAKAETTIEPGDKIKIQSAIKEFIQVETQKEVRTKDRIKEEVIELFNNPSLDFFIRESFESCAEKDDCGPGITNVTSDITYGEIVKLKGNKAKAEAIEHRVWYYGDKESTTGEGICNHSFVLVKQDNQWEVERFEDGCGIKSQPMPKENGPGGPSLEETMKRQTIQLWRMKEITSDELQSIQRMKERFPEMKIEYEKPVEINLQEKNSVSVMASSYSYNRNNAAWYGRYYAIVPNYSFRYFTLDCTNFISQAAWYGYWSMVSWWPDKYSRYVWWYTFGWPNTQSHTWTSADMWRYFTSSRPRGYTTSNRCNLQLGDIVQQDLERNGTMDHSMVVTYKNGCYIKVSYHTPNTRDRWLDEIMLQNPTSYFYSWRLYDYGN